MQYDFVIVGSGIYGSICARELTDKGYSCLVIEKRNHIGGNCYTEKIENIDVHKYGAHIFHTSNKMVWDYVNKFVEFNNYRHHVIANYKNQHFSLPFNMFTFNKLWGFTNPSDVIDKIEKEKFQGVPSNLEEQSISLVGLEIYEKFVKGYTAKQWMKSPVDLPPFIIKRIPVRFTYDNNYFCDKYQGIPVNGYTELFETLLNGIEVRLDTNFFENRVFFQKISKKIIYTGPIDKFFDYKHGCLEYRPLRFETEVLNLDNYQGVAVMNFTELEVPYTRIIEHKHFNNSISKKTVVTKEFPVEWTLSSEPYYPINDDKNSKIYSKYFDETKKIDNVVFGGRLAEYKYYDMHQVVESALNFVSTIAPKIIR